MRRTACFLLAMTVASAIGPAARIAGAQSSSDADAAREKAALKFAQEHHPELAGLLKRLKSTDEAAYRKAVRDVFQSSERLTRLERNDAERYDKALRVWTLDSRIRLLAARSTMSDDPEIDEQLRKLLRQRRQARREMLELDRRRLQSRIERIDDQLKQLQRGGDEAIDNELARLKRAVTARRSRKTAPARDRNDATQKTDKQDQSPKRPERKKSADGGRNRTAK